MQEMPRQQTKALNEILGETAPSETAGELELQFNDLDDALAAQPNEPTLEELGNQFRVTKSESSDSFPTLLAKDQIIVPRDEVRRPEVGSAADRRASDIHVGHTTQAPWTRQRNMVAPHSDTVDSILAGEPYLRGANLVGEGPVAERYSVVNSGPVQTRFKDGKLTSQENTSKQSGRGFFNRLFGG